jgi:carbon monoxide dehydrogenase subunit G
MKLVNEFEVAAPLERTWPLLLDVPRVGRALPGASIEPAGGDGGYRGTMKLKLGAVTAQYAGTARLEEVDEDARVARFEVQGREASGQGTAAATIVSRLRASGEATRVVVETDLRVTGRQAQIGGTLMEDVAAAVLDRFAQALERELRGETPDADGGEDAFAVGGVMAKALAGRAALVAAGAAIGMVTGLAIGRWRWGSR